ncbi:3'-5' exonuclease [Cronobacter sakazakii]|uniref:3'-5' exonuclease n=1 Tax=Cronobacter sakazakii TaxID=28141 RepID=UPI000B4BFD16|nr:3'-5' exonuclease [Cronobacter sakazakii]EKA9346337.1 3'-5' exoribonuclease [Cronobacter sakazakii]ELL7784321.1 3'-5' exoribonuclease [Cronobacter sakazakii]ELY2558615.1 3'-5' exoribonuclease [Cronobacter sakazakii]ELY2753878.1 3'-5' exoribonuclease [Cronobacter sakazakii]ELY3569784.1 3'-5' exoribonuclease [Cronobacter sakazakii]
MNHLMIDLETMGNKPTAPIIAIGAVLFEPSTGVMGPEYYAVADLESSMVRDAVADPGTILWWLKQSAEARAAITSDNRVHITNALGGLIKLIEDNCEPKSLQVWGNGATFDNVIIRATFERHGFYCPWRFWNDRDVRTIVEMGRAAGFYPRYEIPFEGDLHNALADAKHQVKYVSAIWQRLIPATSNNI